MRRRLRRAARGALQIQDRSPQLRPAASGCVCDWWRDATGLDCGNRSWICNAPELLLDICVQQNPLLTYCSTVKSRAETPMQLGYIRRTESYRTSHGPANTADQTKRYRAAAMRWLYYLVAIASLSHSLAETPRLTARALHLARRPRVAGPGDSSPAGIQGAHPAAKLPRALRCHAAARRRVPMLPAHAPGKNSSEPAPMPASASAAASPQLGDSITVICHYSRPTVIQVAE